MAAVERDLRFSEKYPELGQSPISIEPCISPEYYSREVEKVFKRVWLKVGRVEELPEPGSFKLKRLDFAKVGALLVRGQDGVIRAFHNVCSHRGNKVIWSELEETVGRKNVFTCHFHGWGYNDRGELVAVPEENRFPRCFERGENGLAPIHCEVWEGFIFVNLAEKPQSSLKEFLGGLGELYAGYPFHEITQVVSYHAHMKCNWKVGVDAFAEAYHLRTIHGNSTPGTVCDIEAPQLFGDHRTASVCFKQPQTQPATGSLALRKARASVVGVVAGKTLPPQMNPDRRKDFGFELSVAFPNFLLHAAEGIWFTHQFWPTSYNSCLWEGHFYVREPLTHSQRWAVEYSTVQQRNLWLEDTATMEATQEALESRAKKFLQLQDGEILLRHGYHVLEKYMQG
jgi:phenylpropionate dioxygenase-like ring-hydroxylating dioxygenase large terminal subunit